MKYLTGLSIIWLCVQSLLAQDVQIIRSVTASGGELDQGTEVLMSWTLGDIAVETLVADSTFVLTEGFQQPENSAYSVGTEKWDNLTQTIGLKIFPNPTAKTVWIESPAPKRISAEMFLFGVDGRQLIQENITLGMGEKTAIPMEGFAAGTYMLQVIAKEAHANAVFHIQYRPH